MKQNKQACWLILQFDKVSRHSIQLQSQSHSSSSTQNEINKMKEIKIMGNSIHIT